MTENYASEGQKAVVIKYTDEHPQKIYKDLTLEM